MIVSVLVLVVVVAPASAQVVAWDGTNPFNCTLHQAGFEATDPSGAKDDPYCVEFDKRRQNVSELGVVEFLSKEPARVAAAVDKCFYFQHDHWRGSFVQEDGSTKTYEWDGSYFFDKAKGEGGAYVENFNFNGRTGDPSTVPFMPPEYAQHMGPGTGGVRVVNSMEPDPACAEKARAGGVYAAPKSSTEVVASPARCREPGSGRVTSRGIGPIRIGMTERDVRGALGPPAEIRRGFLRYCDGGGFLVGQRGDRSGDLGGDEDEKTVMVVATTRAFVGRPRMKTRRRVAKLGRISFRARRRSNVVYGVRGGRAVLVAVYDRKVIRTRAGLETYLRRAIAGA